MKQIVRIGNIGSDQVAKAPGDGYLMARLTPGATRDPSCRRE